MWRLLVLISEHPKNKCLSQTHTFKYRWHIVFLIMVKYKKEKKDKQERRLHYGLASQSSSKEFLWYFLIIEESREMKRVKQGICDELKSIESPSVIKEGIVGNSHGLNYSLLSLRSQLDKVNFSQLYYGKLIMDERFNREGSPTGLLFILEQEGIVPTFPRGYEFSSPEDNHYSNDTSFPDYTR